MRERERRGVSRGCEVGLIRVTGLGRGVRSRVKFHGLGDFLMHLATSRLDHSMDRGTFFRKRSSDHRHEITRPVKQSHSPYPTCLKDFRSHDFSISARTLAPFLTLTIFMNWGAFSVDLGWGERLSLGPLSQPDHSSLSHGLGDFLLIHYKHSPYIQHSHPTT